MNQNNEIVQEQDNANEYPDNKPVTGNTNVKKIVLVSAGILVACTFLWAAFAGGGKSKKITHTAQDTLSTPGYEQGMKRNISATNSAYPQSGSNGSLMPTVDRGQEGFDASQVQGNPSYSGNPSQGRPTVGEEENYRQEGVRSSNVNQYGSRGGSGNNGYSGPSEPPSPVSREVQQRMDAAYQTEVEHFKGTKKFAWSVDDATFEKLKTGDKTSNVEPVLKDLYEGASAMKSEFGYTIAAGSRIIATTDQPVSTDHPGYFTSTVVRPFELKGAKLICQAGPNQNNRIPVQPTKIVLHDKTELTVSGQIEMGFPGLEGKVTNHWVARTIPAVLSAAAGGGAAAYLLNSSSPTAGQTNAGNISTRDLIAGPILESSVQQVQNEIMRYSKDRPNTVLVKAGQQFSILLTDKLTFKM